MVTATLPIRQSPAVPLNTKAFVDLLLAEVPELRELVVEHLADHDEVLLHVLTACVRHRAIEEFDNGDRGLAGRIADVYGRGITEGDERVENAAAVSFVEDTPVWDPARTAFIKSWPEPLRAEVERQRNWRA